MISRPSLTVSDGGLDWESLINEVRDIVRKMAGDVPALRFAILNSSTGLFLSNLRGREASDMAKLALNIMPLLRPGDFAVKVDNKGIPTLVFRADNKITIVLGGAWSSPGLMVVCARSIYAHLGEALGAEPGEDFIPLIAEGRVAELLLEPASLALLAHVDGEASVADVATSAGVDELRAREILNALRERGILLASPLLPIAEARPRPEATVEAPRPGPEAPYELDPKFSSVEEALAAAPPSRLIWLVIEGLGEGLGIEQMVDVLRAQGIETSREEVLEVLRWLEKLGIARRRA